MDLTRRSFLKAGAFAAAGLWGGGLRAGAAAGRATAAGQPPLQGAVRPTAHGPVEGCAEGPAGCLAWHGVPYGAAPSGALRWQSPQEPAPWDAPLDCTAPGPMALQACNGAAAGSEDCLRLDIYAPDGAAGRPVVVYFHGGGNHAGTVRELPGRRLAAQAGCVFVAAGYRLGLLGFNSLPALCSGPDATGNFALLDAARALDWVQENIASFGGDPHNVTVMGFSAGGRDVMAMLASPCFAGRFHKAVSLSGGLTLSEPGAAARQTARAFAPLAVEDGLFAAEPDAAAWLLTAGDDVRRWLYDLDPARVCLLMPGGGDLRMDSFPHLFADGVMLPAGGFAQAEWNAVPLMLVTGATEFSLFNPLPAWYEAEGLSPAEAAAARSFANRCGSALYRDFNGAGCAAALAPRYGAPIWLCEVAYGAPDSRSPVTALDLGSWHGVSLPLLSGENNMAGLADLSSPGYAAMADAFLGSFRAFLESGSPAASGLGWQPWTPAAPCALVLDAGPTADSFTAALRPAPAGCAPGLFADASLSDAARALVLHKVLHGRFFRAGLDTASA